MHLPRKPCIGLSSTLGYLQQRIMNRFGSSASWLPHTRCYLLQDIPMPLSVPTTPPPLPSSSTLFSRRHRPLPPQQRKQLFHTSPPVNRPTRMPSSALEYLQAASMNQTPATSSGSWVGAEGAAAFDLRSDTQTTPTAAMLSAVRATTLLDDVMGEDPTTAGLEAHVADITGKEAGLFVLSGTMGNQIALRSLLTQPPHGVLADHRSHIIRYEAGGVASLSGAMITPVVPSNGRYLTLADVESHAVLSDDVHACPTRVISLENTLSGLIMPLDEVRRISTFARARGILMHCDGARLWEVIAAATTTTSAASSPTLRDFCACFDTVSLCFSKGLGAPVGSILVGTADLVRRARWTRKALGGGLRQAGVVTAAARVAVDETFGRGPAGEGGLLRASHDTARRVEALWIAAGGRTELPVETNTCWLDLGSMSVSAARFEELGRAAGLKLMGNRLITHYQIGEDAVRRLAGVFDQVRREKEAGGSAGADGSGSGSGSGPYK